MQPARAQVAVLVQRMSPVREARPDLFRREGDVLLPFRGRHPGSFVRHVFNVWAVLRAVDEKSYRFQKKPNPFRLILFSTSARFYDHARALATPRSSAGRCRAAAQRGG